MRARLRRWFADSSMPLGTHNARLRILAHARRALLTMIPLGALMGLVVALALAGLNRFEDAVEGRVGEGHWAVLLPGLALVLTTLWLTFLKLGPVSLSADLALAPREPYRAFPFRTSLAKVAGCVLTIGLGGSAGVEGPGKWLGAAVGLQVHRVMKALASRFPFLRRRVSQPLDMLTGGAAGAMAAIFRAPLSGALFVAEHDGVLRSERLVVAVVAAAAGYLSFQLWTGSGPLLPLVTPVALGWRELLWAVPLGLLCGLGSILFGFLRSALKALLAPLSLVQRGFCMGLLLVLLALPASFFWGGLLVTQDGGLKLVGSLVNQTPALGVALAFFALKTLATAATFEGGGIGGTWLPSVAMGATVGASFEALIHTGHPGMMVVLGATAFTGAVHGTLLVPVVFLAETTAQASLVVPGIIATTMAFLVAREA